jgi:hypothetical protein
LIGSIFAGAALGTGVILGEGIGFIAGDAPGDGEAFGVGVAAAPF